MNRRLLLVLLAAVVVGAALFLTRPEQRAAPGGGETISFADTSFETLWVNNAIAGYIIENGYGYPVETVEVTVPIAQQSLANGELDIYMELWRTNSMDWYLRVTESGEVLDLGPVFERSTQGFYVPRYVVEGDPERGIEASAPDLASVFDLPRYRHLFADPSEPDKGLLVSCIIGWECQEINAIKLHAYGLADDFNLQEPGTAAALDSAIAGAYTRGQPVLAYYWEPTWLVGTYDLIQLEEPPYTDECNQEIQRIRTERVPLAEVDESAGCHYEELAIHKGVTSGLQDRAPEVVAFLENMNVGTDRLNEITAAMRQEDMSPDEGALWFFENYEDRWRAWLPDDVAQRVADALIQDGVSL